MPKVKHKERTLRAERERQLLPKNKFNQGDKRHVLIIIYWKNKLRKTQISRSTYHGHEQEKLTSLKCPCYPKQSIDSTQFLSRHQWCISQN